MNALSMHTKVRAALILAAVCMLAFSPRVTMAQGPTPASKSASQPQQEPSSQQQPQQPAPPPASSSTSGQAGSSSSSGKRGHGHANDFLLIGTVFNDKAYAFPGAHVRARRTTEKKFRWETYTNSRGEFALRVPQGEEYEIVVNAKGFADQGGSVSAKSGISEETVVYRMQPATGGKK